MMIGMPQQAIVMLVAVLCLFTAGVGTVAAQAQDAGKEPVEKMQPAPTGEVKNKKSPDDGDAGKPADDESRKKRSASFGIGMSLYGAAWDPVWGGVNRLPDMGWYHLLNPNYFKLEKISKTYTVQPSILFGLHFTAEFPSRWGIATNVMLGTYDRVYARVYALKTNPADAYAYEKLTMNNVKFDTDILATYRFDKWFKIFFGPKYQGYTFKEIVNNSMFTMLTENLASLGFGLGGALTVGLVDNLYFVPNLSFMALYGTATGNNRLEKRRHPISVGGNAMVPFAYYIERIRTTVSLGFRYQFLYYIQTSSSNYLNRWDHFYGAIFSVNYSF